MLGKCCIYFGNTKESWEGVGRGSYEPKTKWIRRIWVKETKVISVDCGDTGSPTIHWKHMVISERGETKSQKKTRPTTLNVGDHKEQDSIDLAGKRQGCHPKNIPRVYIVLTSIGY